MVPHLRYQYHCQSQCHCSLYQPPVMHKHTTRGWLEVGLCMWNRNSVSNSIVRMRIVTLTSDSSTSGDFSWRAHNTFSDMGLDSVALCVKINLHSIQNSRTLCTEFENTIYRIREHPVQNSRTSCTDILAQIMCCAASRAPWDTPSPCWQAFTAVNYWAIHCQYVIVEVILSTCSSFAYGLYLKCLNTFVYRFAYVLTNIMCWKYCIIE
jgi:hypothetical protein